MAMATGTVTEGKEFTVTDEGIAITFGKGIAGRILLVADIANAGLIEYSFSALPGARANDAAIKAAGVYLAAGESKQRTDMSITTLYARTTTGVTGVLRVDVM